MAVKPSAPKKASALVLVALCAAVAAPRAGAEEAAPAGARTTLTGDLFARVAPDGAMIFAGVLRRWGVSDGDAPLLQGRYFQAGASVGVNPAYAQGAISGEWVPVAPLQLHAQYDLYEFFGANGALLRFPSAASRFGKAEQDALAGSDRSGVGHRLMLSPVLRARAGRLILRSQTDLAWFALSTAPGWFYEWEYDTLLAERDFLVSNRTTMLFEVWRGDGETTLLAGPGYEVTHAGKSGITRQRAEGVVYWSPATRLGDLDRPRLFAVAGVNIEDRNRQLEPFVVLGVGADIDL
jgi:hypothetical protein